MSEMVERVARALRSVNSHDPEGALLPHGKFSDDDVRRLAYFALKEVRDAFSAFAVDNCSLNYASDEIDAELREGA